MTDGIYAKYSKRIKEITEQDILVVDVEKLAGYVDVSDIPREELERAYQRAAAHVALYTNGFRSVERGSGYFLDYKNSDNPIYLQKLVDNANLDATQKEVVYKAMKQIKQRCVSTMPDYVQYAFQFDENGDSRIIAEMSHDELVEMLKKDAEAAV